MIQVQRTPKTDALEPITVAEAKNYLKIDFADDDTLIGSLITAAREQAEQFCNKSFIASDVVYQNTNWVSPIALPYPIHDEITSVKVGDATVTQFGTVGVMRKIITIYFGIDYPQDYGTLEVAYSTTGGTTEAEKNAILKIVCDMYENRLTSPTDEHLRYLLPFKVF